jgi:hypothetical protein
MRLQLAGPARMTHHATATFSTDKSVLSPEWRPGTPNEETHFTSQPEMIQQFFVSVDLTVPSTKISELHYRG